MKNPTVYIVHCIDTEGPLYESTQETFKRLEDIFGLTSVEPTKKNLERLQNKEINLGGLENDIVKVIAKPLLNYNLDYAMLDAMLEKIGSNEFINQYPDSKGNGWLYNWHCVDHIGYDVNIRRKDIGYHNIYDYYRQFIKESNRRDSIHWHYHPSHYRKFSHYSATNYLRDNKFFEIIARRIIERKWFPSVNRAGFHVERPDSHWLLEQYIPFDISNQAMDVNDQQIDMSEGRFGDWRRATKEWSIYQPNHDDYQIPGDCRRYIARCLNIGTRYKCITEEEVEKAFLFAEKNGNTLMAFTNHDFRDMANDVLLMKSFLRKVKSRFPNVDFEYADARKAMNMCLFNEYNIPENGLFTLEIKNNASNITLEIVAREEIFGPQPFLSLETIQGKFYHENLDFQIPFKKWSYTFDHNSFRWKDIVRIGVGTNDKKGFPQTAVIDKEHIGTDVLNIQCISKISL